MEQVLVKDFAISYYRQKGKFVLSLGESSIEQNVCEFLLTSSFLVGQDVEQYLLSTDNAYDTVRIPLTGTGKTITLGLSEFIRLREAYARQMFLLKLEDLLLRKGVRFS